jgi:hypothetical protein
MRRLIASNWYASVQVNRMHSLDESHDTKLPHHLYENFAIGIDIIYRYLDK